MANIDLQETKDELQWLEKKLDIKARRLIPGQTISVTRGEVYGCDFGYNIGTELRGYHPCVIIENDATSINRQSVCVAPITHATQRKKSALLVPITQQTDAQGKLLIEGYVDVAGIRSVSKARLTQRKAVLTKADMLAVDRALASVTDLYGYYKTVEGKLETAQKRGDAKEEKIKVLRSLLLDVQKELSPNSDQTLKQRIQEALAI